MFNFYLRGLKNSRTRFGEIRVEIFGTAAAPGAQHLFHQARGTPSHNSHSHCSTQKRVPSSVEVKV